MTKNQPTTATIANPMSIIRDAFPKMRRTAATAIIHSGGRKTIFGCLCGSRHTTSTDWHGRDALHVREWQGDHAACAGRIAAEILSGKSPKIILSRV